MSKNDSLGREIYEGAGTFGHIQAWISAIMSTIIGIILIVVGVVAIRHKTTLTDSTIGTVTKAECGDAYNDGNDIKYNCTVDVSYEVKNKEYDITKSVNDTSKSFKNEKLTVYYNPSSPKDGELNSDNTKTIGIILTVVGVIIPLAAWLWVWVTSKSKFAAAAGGVAGAVNLIRG